MEPARGFRTEYEQKPQMGQRKKCPVASAQKLGFAVYSGLTKHLDRKIILVILDLVNAGYILASIKTALQCAF